MALMPVLKSYRNPKIKVSSSLTHGRGNIAQEKIHKNEVVWIKSGHILTYDQAMDANERLGHYVFQLNDDFFLGHLSKEEEKDIALYNNHSCDANVGIYGQTILVAMRDIQVGEECTLDYGTITSYPFEMDCDCGSKKCRGKVTGEDWKNLEMQKQYDGYFTYYLQEKIKNL